MEASPFPLSSRAADLSRLAVEGSAVSRTILGNVFRQSAARGGGNRTGAPRSLERTWAENDGRSPTIALAESISEPMSDRESIRTGRPVTIRCCYDTHSEGMAEAIQNALPVRNANSSFPSRPLA
jgi:hypothetical protein